MPACSSSGVWQGAMSVLPVSCSWDLQPMTANWRESCTYRHTNVIHAVGSMCTSMKCVVNTRTVVGKLHIAGSIGALTAGRSPL